MLKILLLTINRIRVIYWRLIRPIRIGVKCLITFDNEKNILLVRTKYTHGWMLPGGGCRRNESPAEACLREVKEETGLELNESDVRIEGIYFNEKEYKRDIIFLFHAELNNSAKINRGFEISEVNILTMDEAKDVCSPATARRIQEHEGATSRSFDW